jgi:superfamily II DNA/RNA helicase
MQTGTYTTPENPTASSESCAKGLSTTKANDDGQQQQFAEATQAVAVFDSFEALGVSDELLRGIFAYGFEKPSAIQQRAIKPLTDGRDTIAQAQSGTGKTAAFGIGVLQSIDHADRRTQAIIMAPTRELALQIEKVVLALGEHLKSSVLACVGGTSVSQNRDKLAAGVHVVIGTPGRIFDLINRRMLFTDQVKLFILDEADEMLSAGFKGQIYDIFRFMPPSCQVGLFSATMSQECLDVTDKFMRDPVKILVQEAALTLDGIRQFYVNVEREEWKLDTLCDLYETLTISQVRAPNSRPSVKSCGANIEQLWFCQCVIFTNTRRKVDWIVAQLNAHDFTVSCLHGEMEQSERDVIMR